MGRSGDWKRNILWGWPNCNGLQHLIFHASTYVGLSSAYVLPKDYHLLTSCPICVVSQSILEKNGLNCSFSYSRLLIPIIPSL